MLFRSRLILEVIAKNQNGEEVYQDSKIYMPVPARMGSVNQMGRGPYEKSGMIRDTAIPPLRTVREAFEIPFPYDPETRKISVPLEVEVRLLYLPFGERNADHFIWDITKDLVTIE